ncbi:MAG: alanine racemase [Phycisphaerae bacterium]|nr:alanine racemase [Phycisphaerae bacterium]NUQ47829.1 alanine racemase [Phycisphaerae bacterium]
MTAIPDARARSAADTGFPEVVAEIFTDHLVHNVRALRACCKPDVRLCAPLKADAYGHGLSIVAPVLDRVGVDCAAVATLDEAVALRRTGWRRPILVLGAVLTVGAAGERTARLEAALRHELTLTLADAELLADIDAAVRSAGRTLGVHIKIDSGMGRMGAPIQHAADLIDAVRRCDGLRIDGIYSHFGSAELEDTSLVDGQLAAFHQLLERVGGLLPRDAVRHFANTSATILRADAHFDMVRPGLGLYGYLPAPRLAERVDLRPCLRLKSRVTLVKTLPADHCVGYGCTFRTRRPTRLGIVPIGYHDGYVRALSNRAVIGTPFGDAPVVGRISMDQTAIDVTDLPQAVCGTEVTILDPQRSRPNSVEAIATLLGTIPYEVTCLLGPRIRRIAT